MRLPVVLPVKKREYSPWLPQTATIQAVSTTKKYIKIPSYSGYTDSKDVLNSILNSIFNSSEHALRSQQILVNTVLCEVIFLTT